MSQNPGTASSAYVTKHLILTPVLALTQPQTQTRCDALGSSGNVPPAQCSHYAAARLRFPGLSLALTLTLTLTIPWHFTLRGSAHCILGSMLSMHSVPAIYLRHVVSALHHMDKRHAAALSVEGPRAAPALNPNPLSGWQAAHDLWEGTRLGLGLAICISHILLPHPGPNLKVPALTCGRRGHKPTCQCHLKNLKMQRTVCPTPPAILPPISPTSH